MLRNGRLRGVDIRVTASSKPFAWDIDNAWSLIVHRPIALESFDHLEQGLASVVFWRWGECAATHPGGSDCTAVVPGGGLVVGNGTHQLLPPSFTDPGDGFCVCIHEGIRPEQEAERANFNCSVSLTSSGHGKDRSVDRIKVSSEPLCIYSYSKCTGYSRRTFRSCAGCLQLSCAMIPPSR